MKIVRMEQPANAPIHLTWLINNICTNGCSYCPPSLHSGKNHHYKWENAKKFFKLLFEKYPKIHCSVSGGEPSVSPFFKEIVKIFHNAGHTIGVTSNAVKSTEYWEEISPYLNYICFSYHPEYSTGNFIEKVKAAGKLTPVTVRVMMHPNFWTQCVNQYELLKQIEFINVEPVKLVYMNDADNSYIYTDEQLLWLTVNTGTKRHLDHISDDRFVPDINPIIHFANGTVDNDPNTVDYINNGMTNFNGYQCHVGLMSLFVEWSGEVYLANCCINGSIGNINEPEKINWPGRPVICNKNLCHCTTDVNIEKRLV